MYQEDSFTSATFIFSLVSTQVQISTPFQFGAIPKYYFDKYFGQC